MGLLIQRVAEVSGYSPEQGLYDVAYPTGFLNFDHLNGYNLNTFNDKGELVPTKHIGLLDGSYNLLIGRSGSGKSTFAVQAGANIISQFEDAEMMIQSMEGGITVPRLETLTGYVGNELFNRISIKNSGITAESIYDDIYSIYETKIKNKEKFLYDTGMRDSTGNPIMKFTPTVMVIDSIALLAPERIADKGELSGQMAATAMAKANTALLKGVMQLIKATNIILLVINHITEKIEANPMMHTKGALIYLKQGESLPGGKAVTYLANNIIRFDDSKLKEETFGFSGAQVDISLGKSRTNKAGKSTPLIFSQENGFDSLYSLMVMLKDAGVIVTKGAYLALDGYEPKFRTRDFKQLFMDDEEFRKAFVRAANTELEKLLTPIPTGGQATNASITKDLIATFKALED